MYSSFLFLLSRLHRWSKKSIRSRKPMLRTDGCAFRISYAKEATGTSVVKSRRCIRSAISKTSCSRSADMYAGRAKAYFCASLFLFSLAKLVEEETTFSCAARAFPTLPALSPSPLAG